MIKFQCKEECCGCTACCSICPMKAIQMQPDEEGFMYPKIDKEKCINCGLCDRVCPVKNKLYSDNKPTGYIMRVLDEKLLKDSTSGGAFSAFAIPLIHKGYVVFGTGYDKQMKVVLKKAETVDQLVEMRGSKFVQSDLGDSYSEVKRLLDYDKKVAFFGTPCQIAGLINFLGNKPDSLFCVDFVCRGVPSPMLWDNYVNLMEKKFQSHILSAKFKNKTYGYHATTMKIVFENGKEWYGSGRIDPMMKAFVNELASRPSCSCCSFKGVNRLSDITMFDCYEFSKITGLQDDEKGYSSLFVHSEIGKRLLNEVKENIFLIPVDYEKLTSKNGIMVFNSAMPHPKRSEFYQLIKQYSIDSAMQKILPITKIDYFIECLKKYAYRYKLIKFLKKFKKKTLTIAKK